MADRMSRDKMLISVAFTFAERATCDRLHVGAVFSRDGRIIVTGYNGAPAGIEHCNHTCSCNRYEYEAHGPACRSLQPCTISEHAEQNAIAFAAKHGLALDGSELHVTHAPCLSCARSIINAGVRKVSYVHGYRNTWGLDLLSQAGVELVDSVLERG